jgi:two-component system response regulator AtoC
LSDERTRSHGFDSERDASKPRLLAFWDGGFTTRTIPDEGTLVVGRSQACDVRIQHPSASRKHAAIHGGARLQIEDLGSQNGTRLAGKRLAPHQRVDFGAGELVEIGVALLLLQPAGTASSMAAPGAPLGSLGVTLTPPADDGTASLRMNRLVDLVAASSLSVILSGETGVGKEVVAAKIHHRSTRSGGPFVRFNSAALTETILESELFGHERGAFTGAVRTKPGLLEAANGGTVFLDEIGDMPLSTQAKLLRAIENREVLRVGSVQPLPIDVRFVAATNRDLTGLIAGGSFRSDLFFRLNGITLQIPPLRERIEEIAPLAEMFVEQACRAVQRGTLGISGLALRRLQAHVWPGNIRELRNLVERAVVLCSSETILPEHLVFEPLSLAAGVPKKEPPLPQAAPDLDLRRNVEGFERDRILAALEHAKGNQTRAAELLGVSRRTLVNRLGEYDLPRPRKNSHKG